MSDTVAGSFQRLGTEVRNFFCLLIGVDAPHLLHIASYISQRADLIEAGVTDAKTDALFMRVLAEQIRDDLGAEDGR